MLALLFLLMPNNSSYHLPRNPVDLTESRHASSMPGALKEDAIRIKVARDGQIYFSDLRVSRDKLPDLIQEALTKGAEKKVYILADARARYGKVMEVLSEVRVAEVEKVCFLTE